MWIELHSRTRFHPKTKKLARRLGIPKPHAIGYLTTLWMWTVDMADDGDLSRFDEEDIEDGAEWEGEPGVLVAALVVVGFLDELEDGGLVIHDWRDYAKFLYERERKAKQRADKKGGPRTSGDNPGTSQEVPANRTEPTEPTEPTNRTEPTDLAGLDSVYASRFGSMGGEQQAMEILSGLSPFTADDIADIEACDANTWLYVAKMLGTNRAKRHRRPPKRVSGTPPDDGERFASDAQNGMQQVLQTLVAAKTV